jgi:hypothetical protein
LRHFGSQFALLDISAIQCLCAACYRGPPQFYCGDPPRLCVVPTGCVRVALRHDPDALCKLPVSKRYYSCFHGTSISNAGKIIACAQLLHPGDELYDGELVEQPDGHIKDGQYLIQCSRHMGAFGYRHELVKREHEGNLQGNVFNPRQLYFTSPSLRYALEYSPAKVWGGDTVQVCLEMKQDPDCVNVLHETLWRSIVDELIPQDEMEWFTERRFPSIVPVALLVRILPAQAVKCAGKCGVWCVYVFVYQCVRVCL